jgi:hypothetical protein
MADPLSDEQLQYVREFFTSETARQMFQNMQDGLVSDWINTQDAASRELIWLDIQALLRLAITLRDAAADKRLTMRRQQSGV